MLSNINIYAACTVRVTIFSTDGEIPPCFNFYIVTRSYSSRPFLCALVVHLEHILMYPLSNSCLKQTRFVTQCQFSLWPTMRTIWLHHSHTLLPPAILAPRPPSFLLSLCIQTNAQKQKSGKNKEVDPWLTHTYIHTHSWPLKFDMTNTYVHTHTTKIDTQFRALC